MANVFLIVAALILIIYPSKIVSISCDDGLVACADGSECIKSHWICDGDADCDKDKSDENPNLCQFIKKKQLLKVDGIPATSPVNCTETKYFETVLSHFESIYDNHTRDDVSFTSNCPLLYTPVENLCVSAFTIAKTSWFNAKNFCNSIGGRMLTIKEAIEHSQIITFLKNSGFTDDFWIGGFNIKASGGSSWVWNDGTPMPMGAPFWALSETTRNCTKPQRSVHNNCQRRLIRPFMENEMSCAALSYQNYFFFSDHDCYEPKSPICVVDTQG